MKLFPYLQYFFYLGINWNWRIAFHILSYEIKGERKYGIFTTGSDELNKIKASGVDISHATVYMPASYLLLEEIFAKLPTDHRNHFLDIGCGKGRALCVAAHNGFSKVTGVDFSSEFCAASKQNLQLTKTTFPSLDYTVITKDATDFEIPEEVDCIFFFNPFDHIIMNKVAKNIEASYRKNPRDMYIVYLNPLYKNDLLQIGFTEIFYTCKMKYMEAVILERKAPLPEKAITFS